MVRAVENAQSFANGLGLMLFRTLVLDQACVFWQVDDQRCSVQVFRGVADNPVRNSLTVRSGDAICGEQVV